MQNAAARLATSSPWQTPSAPLLTELHWLPVNRRIQFKVLSFIHRIIFSPNVPTYLKHSISLRNPVYPTRLSESPNLEVKVARYRRSGDRAFSFGAPPLWNNLPSNIKTIADFKTFKCKLKTHLFSTF